jgi:hypothetical protein
VLQKAASVRDGGAWALLYVLCEEELGFFAYLVGSSRALELFLGSSDLPCLAVLE